jgi:orotate phosphoribosyltransferase
MDQDKYSLEIATHLLEIKAIKLKPKRPFTWSSGWKSPIYCDNRLSLSYPSIRTLIKNQLAEMVRNKFRDVECIAGVATAGIPQGALLADSLDLPFVYVRSSPKGHGLENLIEGKVTKRQKVVIMEDLVSTGGSSLKAAEALKASGFKVLGMVAIFTYGFELAAENFRNAGIPLHTLSSYADMLVAAQNKGMVSEKDLMQLKSWRVDPENWGR